MFMNQDIKFPSQNYYIYFDKPSETTKPFQSLKKKPKKQLIKNEEKPAWFLEKKVQTL